MLCVLSREVCVNVKRSQAGGHSPSCGCCNVVAPVIAHAAVCGVIPLPDCDPYRHNPSEQRVCMYNNKIGPATACFVFVLRALQALRSWHRAGLLHGDVKPGNIVVDTSPKAPVAYLIDVETFVVWEEGGVASLPNGAKVTSRGRCLWYGRRACSVDGWCSNDVMVSVFP